MMKLLFAIYIILIIVGFAGSIVWVRRKKRVLKIRGRRDGSTPFMELLFSDVPKGFFNSYEFLFVFVVIGILTIAYFNS